MRNCAYCGRENPEDAGQCRECGTALAAQPGEPQARQPDPADNSARAVAEKRMLHGALWCIGGIAVTAFTYMAAASGPGGGTYVVAWGAIVFGAIQFFRGLTGKNEQPSTEDVGYDALAYGTRLETQGRAEEALEVYQKIAETYPGTAAARDAQKSIECLRSRIR